MSSDVSVLDFLADESPEDAIPNLGEIYLVFLSAV
jgi:hypothetical protein